MKRYRTSIGNWPKLYTDGKGHWKIRCPRTFYERWRMGKIVTVWFAVIALFFVITVHAKTWHAWVLHDMAPDKYPNNYYENADFYLVCEQYLFAVATSFVIGYLLPSFRTIYLQPGHIRFWWRKIPLYSPENFGVVIESDKLKWNRMFVMAQWGYQGANKKLICSVRGKPNNNRAMQIRAALLLALQNGEGDYLGDVIFAEDNNKNMSTPAPLQSSFRSMSSLQTTTNKK